MSDFMELSNITPPQVWGTWEPLAFFFLTAGAAATILACMAATPALDLFCDATVRHCIPGRRHQRTGLLAAGAGAAFARL